MIDFVPRIETKLTGSQEREISALHQINFVLIAYGADGETRTPAPRITNPLLCRHLRRGTNIATTTISGKRGHRQGVRAVLFFVGSSPGRHLPACSAHPPADPQGPHGQRALRTKSELSTAAATHRKPGAIRFITIFRYLSGSHDACRAGVPPTFSHRALHYSLP